MKKVVVTGANGFIGSAFCKKLVSEGIEVIAVVRNIEADISNINPSIIRSNVGLDSSESLIKGARWLCERGVSPMLSPFRPYACTEYEKYIPASDEEVIAIYDRVSEICRRYKMILGPSCPECEDNTIKISL